MKMNYLDLLTISRGKNREIFIRTNIPCFRMKIQWKFFLFAAAMRNQKNDYDERTDETSKGQIVIIKMLNYVSLVRAKGELDKSFA